MKIQDKIKQRATVVELTMGEFFVLIAAAAWGIGTIVQQIGI